ncbi:MAG: reductive dehalogenase [Dehalogenimonas sp.]
MSKFHSIVSRRDFMKGLGLVGAGLGGAAMVTPVFGDLDELTNSSNTKAIMPWWVKDQDNPTTEIDWNILDHRKPVSLPPFPQGHIGVGPLKGYLAPNERHKQGIMQNISGCTLKDRAITEAVAVTRGAVFGLRSIDGLAVYTNVDWGVPRHEGTPEENLEMVRAAGHFFGAPYIGASVIDDKMLRLTSSRVKFEDVDVPSTDAQKNVIVPKKCKYAITYEIVQSHAMDRHGVKVYQSGPYQGYIPYLALSGCFRGYLDEGIVEHQLQAFIKSLGYIAIPSRSLGFSPPPWGVMAGLGELGRAGIICSPQYGNEVRVTCSMITDMPVAPSKPINAGITKFCETCKFCADNCPSGSISKETEPSWEVNINETGFDKVGNPIPPSPMNQSGIKAWKTDWDKCTNLQGGPRECQACQPACPFSNMNQSVIHPIVRATAATTPLFNTFFANMQELFVNDNSDPSDWWKRDLSSYKFDPLSGGVQANG